MLGKIAKTSLNWEKIRKNITKISLFLKKELERHLVRKKYRFLSPNCSNCQTKIVSLVRLDEHSHS